MGWPHREISVVSLLFWVLFVWDGRIYGSDDNKGIQQLGCVYLVGLVDGETIWRQSRPCCFQPSSRSSPPRADFAQIPSPLRGNQRKGTGGSPALAIGASRSTALEDSGACCGVGKLWGVYLGCAWVRKVEAMEISAVLNRGMDAGRASIARWAPLKVGTEL